MSVDEVLKLLGTDTETGVRPIGLNEIPAMLSVLAAEVRRLREELKLWEQRAVDLANRIDPRMGWPTTEERLRETIEWLRKQGRGAQGQ